MTTTPARCPRCPNSIDEDTIALARTALTVYEIAESITSHVLTQADIDLLTPMRAHLQLAVDRIDNAGYEVEQHGRSYPNGKPRLKLAGDPTVRVDDLRRAA